MSMSVCRSARSPEDSRHPTRRHHNPRLQVEGTGKAFLLQRSRVRRSATDLAVLDFALTFADPRAYRASRVGQACACKNPLFVLEASDGTLHGEQRQLS